MRARRSPVIELPLKITLTTAGVEWFIRNKRQLKQLRMADSRLEYGISVAMMSAAALQKMINIDYIASVELRALGVLLQALGDHRPHQAHRAQDPVQEVRERNHADVHGLRPDQAVEQAEPRALHR